MAGKRHDYGGDEERAAGCWGQKGRKMAEKRRFRQNFPCRGGRRGAQGGRRFRFCRRFGSAARGMKVAVWVVAEKGS